MTVKQTQRVNLDETATIITGYPFKSSGFTESDADIRLLRGDNVAQGFVRWGNAKRWSKNNSEDVESYFLQEGDVILAMDRPWIEAGLKYAAINREDLPALLVQRVACIRGLPGVLDNGYLRYVIGSRAFTNYILAVQTGTAVPHISAKQIKQFEFELPPWNEQKRIARILGSLDEKIELNRRMNHTLEAIARALFKFWFVDFYPVRAKAEGRDTGLPKHIAGLFPGRLVDSELGKIPEGWDVKPLDKIANFLNGLAMQKFPPVDGEPTLPVIKIAQLKKGETSGADLASSKLDPKYVVNDGDLIFSWSGSLEVKVWSGGQGALNQHLFKVTSEKYPRWFCHFWIQKHLEDFRRIAADKAVTMGHIKRSHLSAALCAMPPDEVVQRAAGLLNSLEQQSLELSLQSRKLAEIRDCLFPKLLSGHFNKNVNSFEREVTCV